MTPSQSPQRLIRIRAWDLLPGDIIVGGSLRARVKRIHGLLTPDQKMFVLETANGLPLPEGEDFATFGQSDMLDVLRDDPDLGWLKSAAPKSQTTKQLLDEVNRLRGEVARLTRDAMTATKSTT